MKRFFRVLLLLVLLFGLIEPVAAVFEERDLTQTLRVLKFELKHAYTRMNRARSSINSSRENQQKQMVELMEDCNELSIILYSQKQNFTFDLTYALEEVSKRYRDFSRNRRPFVDIINQMDIEIERYPKLIYTLKCLPPVRLEEDNFDMADSTVILASRLQEEAISLHKKNEEGDRRQALREKGRKEDTPKQEDILEPEEENKPDSSVVAEAIEDKQDPQKEKGQSVLRSLASTLFTGSSENDEEGGREELIDSSSSSMVSFSYPLILIIWE